MVVTTATSRLQAVAGHLQGEGKGQVAILTGCNSPSGIGAATARRLAGHCRAIYVCDVHADHLGALVQELEDGGKVAVHVRVFDAADSQAVRSVVQDAVQRYGRLDIFFANAGIVDHALLHDLDEEEFMQTMRVNTLSVFTAIKHASHAMKARGTGCIIATASVAGLRSGAGGVAYSASKAAVINLCKTSAWQLGGTGIRVNAVCPGLIQTGMTEATFELARQRNTAHKIGQLNPLRRPGQAEEVAAVVEFLAGEGGRYVNAQEITVDGGLSGSLPVMPGKFY